MKVLLFSPTYAPKNGGVETVTGHLARELLNRGHAVLVVTQRYPRTLAGREVIDGVNVRRLLFLSLDSRMFRQPRPMSVLKGIASAFLIPVSALRLYVLTRRFQPDVANIHYVSGPATYMATVAGILRVPLVVSFHGSDVPDTPYGEASERRVRGVCARAVTVTACSEDIRARVAHFLPAHLVSGAIVAYAGVDPAAQGRGQLKGTPETVVAIARLVEKKGIEILVRAVGLLIERHVPVRVVIGGDGPLRQDLETLAASLGASDAITFLGEVDRVTATALLQDAAFVVVPSLWEAFGVVCLEAMSAGKAVIASRTGGIQEIIEDGQTGVLVQPGDPVALADAMHLLLHNLDRAAVLGEHGRRHAASWTWKRMTDRYIDAYGVAVELPVSSSVPETQNVRSA